MIELLLIIIIFILAPRLLDLVVGLGVIVVGIVIAILLILYISTVAGGKLIPVIVLTFLIWLIYEKISQYIKNSEDPEYQKKKELEKVEKEFVKKKKRFLKNISKNYTCIGKNQFRQNGTDNVYRLSEDNEGLHLKELIK